MRIHLNAYASSLMSLVSLTLFIGAVAVGAALLCGA
jgi:hypothetical protein